jgi:hypothetical protein
MDLSGWFSQMVREFKGTKFEGQYDNIVSSMDNHGKFPTAENWVAMSQPSSPAIAVLTCGRQN